MSTPSPYQIMFLSIFPQLIRSSFSLALSFFLWDSFVLPPPYVVPSRASTVYDTIVAHEALVSHEAAIRVARGGGIAKDDLVAMNHL